MKLLTLATTLLLAGSAIAAPNAAKGRERQSRRAAGTKQSQPNRKIVKPQTAINGSEFVSYSSNWGGAVLVTNKVTSVTATFTVPTPSTAGSGSAWVGIDGDTCESSILQTGIDWTKSGSSVTYDAWYEWYPDVSYDFTGITLAPGNKIRATVTAASTKSGSAKIENLTTGKTVTHSFSGESNALCETNAEWIVEDFEECGSSCSLVPFANYGTVTFSAATATVNGATVNAGTNPTIIDMQSSSGSVLSSCSASGSTVTCSYK